MRAHTTCDLFWKFAIIQAGIILIWVVKTLSSGSTDCEYFSLRGNKDWRSHRWSASSRCRQVLRNDTGASSWWPGKLWRQRNAAAVDSAPVGVLYLGCDAFCCCVFYNESTLSPACTIVTRSWHAHSSSITTEGLRTESRWWVPR